MNKRVACSIYEELKNNLTKKYGIEMRESDEKIRFKRLYMEFGKKR